MFREAGYYSRMALGLVKWARVPLEPDPPGLTRRTPWPLTGGRYETGSTPSAGGTHRYLILDPAQEE